MPANLPPQYVKAEEDYRRASNPADRLEILRELFRLLPKHKGTEKLQADLKRKIGRAREELEGSKSSAKKAGSTSWRVPAEGAGQIVLVGPPNSGKSSILAALTHARPEIAAYPFSTRTPVPGMMAYEDAAVQLVDLPPIAADFFEGWMPGIVRSADAALLVADLADDDAPDAIAAVLDRLARVRVELVGALPFDNDDEATQHVKTLVVANKSDADGAESRLELLREWLGDRFPTLAVSAVNSAGLDELRQNAYDILGVMRVYTKIPGKPAERDRPFTVPIGSTVLDLAREVHRDFERTLKHARIWGSGLFDAQTVGREHELRDGDLVELHA